MTLRLLSARPYLPSHPLLLIFIRTIELAAAAPDEEEEEEEFVHADIPTDFKHCRGISS